MKFLEKIKFNSSADILQALDNCKVLHAVPAIEFKDIDSFYLDVVRGVGTPFFSEESFTNENKTGNLWSDIQYAPYKSKSFSHSNTRQPFHTDGAYEKNAPNISFFYCKQKATFGGNTTFLDSKDLLGCLDLLRPDLLKLLTDTPMIFKKGNDGKISKIIEEEKLNWNYFRSEKNKLAEDFHDFLENVINPLEIHKSVCLNEGESLFFKDSLLLHGRTSFIGNRHLRKVGIYV